MQPHGLDVLGALSAEDRKAWSFWPQAGDRVSFKGTGFRDGAGLVRQVQADGEQMVIQTDDGGELHMNLRSPGTVDLVARPSTTPSAKPPSPRDSNRTASWKIAAGVGAGALALVGLVFLVRR